MHHLSTILRRPLMVGAALALAVGLGVAGVRLTQAPGVPQRPTFQASNSVFEDRWGIRVTHVAVTADGGLIDFRYQVVDPDKAWSMLDDPSRLPMLVAEDSGTIINSPAQMAPRHSLSAGRSYFLLFRNTGGAIRSGASVTVVVGDLRLEHLEAL